MKKECKRRERANSRCQAYTPLDPDATKGQAKKADRQHRKENPAEKNTGAQNKAMRTHLVWTTKNVNTKHVESPATY